MNEEIKLTKREPTWNYILNDLALYSLMTKVIHSECATYQDKFDLMYQIELLQKQNKELKERDLIIAMELEKHQNNWNELKEYLKDYIEVLESQKDNVEGLDIFEEHTLDNLEEILDKMQELESRK